MAQQPPGQQRDQHRGQEGQRPDPGGDRLVDAVPDGIVHPEPQAAREHDGHPKDEQADAVPAVMRFDVACAATDRPGGPPDRSGQRHPGALQHPADPPDQDHDRIAGTSRAARRLAGSVAGRDRLPFLRARCPAGIAHRRAVAARVGPGRRAPGRTGRSIADTGRHTYKRSEDADPDEAPRGACRSQRKASFSPRAKGRAAAWTEERRRSDEGRRRVKSARRRAGR